MHMVNKDDSFVSVALVTDNSASYIRDTLEALHAELNDVFVDFEIVIVDQRSDDGTQEVLERLLNVLTSVRFIELAFPVAYDVAVSAALENAIGDFVVIFDPKTDPVGCVPKLVECCKSGADIVIGVAPQKVSIPYRLLRPLSQKLLHNIGYDLPRNATQLRCLSRRTVNAVTRAGRFHHQLFVRMTKTGYPSSEFRYALKHDTPRKKLAAGMRDVVRLLVFNSTKPLRWMSALGMVSGMIAALVALYGIGKGMVATGQFDTAASNLLFESIMYVTLFTMLAFFGEYLGRLLDDRGEQYLYSVVYEKSSSVMIDEDRINVSAESADLSLHSGQGGRK